MLEQAAETLVADDVLRPERLDRVGRFLDADAQVVQTLVRPEAVIPVEIGFDQVPQVRFATPAIR